LSRGRGSDVRDLSKLWLGASILGIVVGAALHLAGSPHPAKIAWAITTLIAVIPMGKDVIGGLLARRPGVDVIALLAMVVALWLGEYLAGAVIALMLSSGEALEAYANRRAREELSSLLERAPRTVTRYEDEVLHTRPIEEVVNGDRLLVKTGEVVPVDGLMLGPGVLDESALTGESRPVERPDHDLVRSGALNAGPAFDLRATANAEESTYAGIIRLVKEAQESKAPSVRLADRYATIFIPVTLVMAGLAWALSGDPVRLLSVLMVATPCPLILAVPIAIVAGISRAAKRGIIVKNGAALETIARGEVLLFDKTGTLTSGVPGVSDVEVFGDVPPDELLRLAASVDQISPHVLAGAIVRAARQRELTLEFPEGISETHGAGIEGKVGGRHVAIGKSAFVTGGKALPARARDIRRRSMMDGSSCVFVAVDGEVAGALLIDDPIRPDSPRVIRSLRKAGIKRVVMVTGDHPDVAESVGAALGVDRILSERAPDEKVEAVQAERAEGVTIMVGDGLNDAPALAAADVGVAMGARGSTASSEAADVVLVVDRLDRLVDAIAISRRSRRIALESVFLGMGLAFGFMFFAAFGLFGPVAGALVQEGIDVASILNALRALGGGRSQTRSGPGTDVAERFRAEHKEFMPELTNLRNTADRLGAMSAEDTRTALESARVFLVVRLPQHEEEEEAAVYPLVAKLIGGEDPMSSMARAHVEISHLARVFRQLLEELPEEGPGPDDITDLRRVLYGLHAILRLHFAQEEEAYAWLASEEPVAAR
jgi:heavy metal translocating P-type ATPase